MFPLLVAVLLGLAVQTNTIDRIIGGEKCVPHSQPWQVALYYFNTFQCGGVLINSWWVLTAAHCNLSNIQIRLGKNKLCKPEASDQFSYADKKFPHCQFDNVTFDNDIMLLKLPSAVEINDYVGIIPLATVMVEEGTECIASGWGTITSPEVKYPCKLRCVNISTVSNQDCVNYYPDDLITDNMLCAGDVAGGKDTCQGDSGGPLVCNGELHGITSWGDPICGLANKPGVFTKVFNYIDWINNIISTEESECDNQ